MKFRIKFKDGVSEEVDALSHEVVGEWLVFYDPLPAQCVTDVRQTLVIGPAYRFLADSVLSVTPVPRKPRKKRKLNWGKLLPRFKEGE